MEVEKEISFGNYTAIISFIVGTLIFGLYYLTSEMNILFVGAFYIIIAVIVNFLVLISIVIRAIKESKNRTKLLKTSGLLLLNIPVLIFYVWISLILLDTMRITFTNATENKLTNINIVGCEAENISELEPNESKTVWVGITGDCSIDINYIMNGHQKSEIVAGYVTGNMGQKMNHKIGGENFIDF
tara:strand:+ start:242 stop:799 length:558 start_codon:yes stop_codon:yes gene_type:complete